MNFAGLWVFKHVDNMANNPFEIGNNSSGGGDNAEVMFGPKC